MNYLKDFNSLNLTLIQNLIWTNYIIFYVKIMLKTMTRFSDLNILKNFNLGFKGTRMEKRNGMLP